MPDLTLTVVIATGPGSNLHPLTLHRAKAAVPFGGKYRLIDFTLANCLHSGLRRVLVLTQYKSHSLQKHLRDGWSIFHPELGEYITPIPPQMRDGQEWYASDFNAIQQNRYLIERSNAREVLILEGDLIYRMDYAEMIRFHREHDAEITIACRSLDDECASAPAWASSDGRRLMLGENDELAIAEASDNPHAMVPMGVYLTERSYLLDELGRAPAGNGTIWNTIADMAGRYRTYGYRFGSERGRVHPDRYWSGVADLDEYYAANMALLQTEPPIDLYQENWNIMTYQGQYPPARTVPGSSGTEGVFVNSMLAAGTIIVGGGVNHSLLYPRVHIGDGAIVEDAILFESVRVGEGVQLRRCIVDKDVHIPQGERIGFDDEADRGRFTLSPGGVIVVPKGYRF